MHWTATGMLNSLEELCIMQLATGNSLWECSNPQVCRCIYIYICFWLTVVEGDPKAPFSITTSLRCRGGRYFFLRIAPVTLDLYLIMLRVKQVGIKYHFLSLLYDLTWDGNLVSWTICEHSTHYANGLVIKIFLKRYLYALKN